MTHAHSLALLRNELNDAFTKFDLDKNADEEEVLRVADELDSIKRDISLFLSLTAGKAETAFDGPFEKQVDGVTVTGSYGTTRKNWDSESLKPLVAEAILEDAMDPATGTVETPLSVLVLQALEYVSFSSWKIGTLKKAGLSPDHFCEKTPGDFKLNIKRNGK